MRGRCHSRLKLSAAMAGLLSAAFFTSSARSEEPKLSISGYDTVAYFTDGKPVQGKAEIEYLWELALCERSASRDVHQGSGPLRPAV